jgi:hypothetical protein
MLLAYLNGKSISDLHPSLNNLSKLNYLITKERRIRYPFGQALLGKFLNFTILNITMLVSNKY